MDKDFNIFQWSAFIGGRDGEQVVIRGNDWEEFKKDVQEVKKQFGILDLPYKNHVQDETITTAPLVTPQEPFAVAIDKEEGINTHWCTIHNVPLELKYSKTKLTKEGKPKPYYAHIGPDGLCFGGDK